MTEEALDYRFDELAHAGQEHLDADHVTRYDRKASTDWSEDIAALKAAGIGPASTVVDLGAGTGSFAAALAPHVGRVVAVDVSEPMVIAIRELGIEAVRAGFLDYRHKGDAPDAIVTRNALHHLPDFWKAIALERIARLLPVGGLLRLTDIVYSFEAAEADAVLAEWFIGAVPDPARGWTALELAEHVREEHSTFAWLLEPMLERVGFEIRERRIRKTRTYATYMCVRR